MQAGNSSAWRKRSIAFGGRNASGAEGVHGSIREVRLSAGAEFIVAIAGDIMTMPGLPRTPAARSIFVNDDGQIEDLFCGRRNRHRMGKRCSCRIIIPSN